MPQRAHAKPIEELYRRYTEEANQASEDDIAPANDEGKDAGGHEFNFA